MSYLLERREIKRCLNPTAMTSAFSVCGIEYQNVVSIVVFGEVGYREKTVAVHYRVAGKGSRIDQCPTRVEMVAVLADTTSPNWQKEAEKLTPILKSIHNCTVIVDATGMGVFFAKILEQNGVLNIVRSNWGQRPYNEDYKRRFFNQRAQSTVHAAEAIKDGRVALSLEYQDELLEQGSRLPFYFDECGRYHMTSNESMLALGIPPPDLFNTVCMAFMEV